MLTVALAAVFGLLAGTLTATGQHGDRIPIAVQRAEGAQQAEGTQRAEDTQQAEGAQRADGTRLDYLIVGARVYDGSGSPWISAAVGISGDRISYVGPVATAPAAVETIDAAGLVLAPGFIDVHTHTVDLQDPERSLATNYLTQGVTTLITGNCGGGPWEIAETLAAMEAAGLGPNVGLLVGHGTVRRAAMGAEDRAPTAAELEQMRDLVRQAMREGAFGMSTGLFYAPGSFASTEEVVELARVVAEFGGLYDSHLRDEGSYSIGLVAAVQEAITVGREAGLPVHISHIKALGPESWGLAGEIVEIIEAARAEGIEVTADQYPYEASSTSLGAAVIPRWAMAGGSDALAERLGDASILGRIHEEMGTNIARRGGAATLVISSDRSGGSAYEQPIEGKSLADLATLWEITPEEAAVRIQLAGGAQIVSFNMLDEDIELFRRQPWLMTASDGSLVLPGEGVPHPRSYGTFTRVFTHWVRESNLLTWEEAIRTATSLPAQTHRLWDRGLVRPGAAADLVVFDAARIHDRATYQAPHAYSQGVVHLFVNGQLAIRDGAITGQRGGRALRRQ
jgi:N-acyl-D-aspartate/D-glutamate deacylase